MAAITHPIKIRVSLELIFRLLRRLEGLHSFFLYGHKPGKLRGPRKPGKNSGSTIQNTEPGRELRCCGTEVVVRKYYVADGRLRPCISPDFFPVLRDTARTAVRTTAEDIS